MTDNALLIAHDLVDGEEWQPYEYEDGKKTEIIKVNLPNKLSYIASDFFRVKYVDGMVIENERLFDSECGTYKYFLLKKPTEIS